MGVDLFFINFMSDVIRLNLKFIASFFHALRIQFIVIF